MSSDEIFNYEPGFEWFKVLPGDIVVIPGEVDAAGWTYMPKYGMSYHVHYLGDLEPATEYTVWRKNEESDS